MTRSDKQVKEPPLQQTALQQTTLQQTSQHDQKRLQAASILGLNLSQSRFLIVLLSLCFQLGLSVSQTAQASDSAWVIPRNSTYVEWEMGYGFSSVNPLQQLSFRPHLEIGILETATVILEAPFLTRRLAEAGLETPLINNGLTDVFLGSRIRILEEPVAIAINAGFKIPTGYNPRFEPVIGDRQLDMELGLNLGYEFYPLEAYVQAAAGYRLRTGFDKDHVLVQQNPGTIGPADQLLFSAESGIWLTDQLFASLNLAGEVALNASDTRLAQSEIHLRPLLAWRLFPAMDLSLQYDQSLWSQNRPFLSQALLGLHFRFGIPLNRGKGLRGGIPDFVEYRDE